jgi:four helix bundle protein
MATKGNPLAEKSFAFAKEIVQWSHDLRDSQVPFALINQLLRSSTSIGANIEEASQGFSRKDFAAKFGISLKEAYESRYWLRLIGVCFPKLQSKATTLIAADEEIIRMLVASIKTTRASP